MRPTGRLERAVHVRRTDRGAERAPTPMRVEEAARISANARNGMLDLSDPDIRRLVGDAHQITVRARLWGEQPERQSRRQKRLLLTGVAVVVTVAVAALFVPLLHTL